MKFVYFTFLLVFQVHYAQSISPQSVNNGGSVMSQTNGSLAFTVGELVVLSNIDSDGNFLGNGFASGATISTLSVLQPDSKIIDINVFPNPTTEFVHIQINHSLLENFTVTILNFQGKEVYNAKYSSYSNVIGVNVSSYASGTYLLILRNIDNNVLGVYKIIKK